ncbi:pilin [Ramlibacter ginsenosidimutans]|uniref:Pilin n=1 Tax=Ramlibacter ginsenosidimutans TaxID=502333 RepID=A0A934TRQ3_9BURK|nr:pilin [Ramlibacter ginsenosidimutans]MBK6005716.1 pilin [Ramlibacter ginsenosidimutans]
MRRSRQQSGFTLVELIVTVCIAAVLASIAMAQMRDYTRRARVSEVVMAASQCKNMVSESYPTLDSMPPPGGWGCEGTGGATEYAGGVQTSSNGVIRIAITNLDSSMNGRFVYMVPAKADSTTAMTTPADLGTSVHGWICGSDLSFVRNALPANCRSDTTTFSTEAFGP